MAYRASDVPPAITQRRNYETKAYLKGTIERRLQTLRDYVRGSSSFVLQDHLALAYLNLQLEFGTSLPVGLYANTSGYWFEIDDYGREKPLQFVQPPGKLWAADRSTMSVPPEIFPGLEFSQGHWEDAPQFVEDLFDFSVDPVQNYAAPIQMQQSPVVFSPGPALAFPVAQQQFDHGPLPTLDDNPNEQDWYLTSVSRPASPIAARVAPRVPAFYKRKATDDDTEGTKRMCTKEPTDFASSAPIPSLTEPKCMIRKPRKSTPAVGPPAELNLFNAQTPWPSDEARLRHEQLKASLLLPPNVDESADASNGEDLFVAPSLPVSPWLGYAPAVSI